MAENATKSEIDSSSTKRTLSFSTITRRITRVLSRDEALIHPRSLPFHKFAELEPLENSKATPLVDTKERQFKGPKRFSSSAEDDEPAEVVDLKDSNSMRFHLPIKDEEDLTVSQRDRLIGIVNDVPSANTIPRNARTLNNPVPTADIPADVDASRHPTHIMSAPIGYPPLNFVEVKKRIEQQRDLCLEDEGTPCNTETHPQKTHSSMRLFGSKKKSRKRSIFSTLWRKASRIPGQIEKENRTEQRDTRPPLEATSSVSRWKWKRYFKKFNNRLVENDVQHPTLEQNIQSSPVSSSVSRVKDECLATEVTNNRARQESFKNGLVSSLKSDDRKNESSQRIMTTSTPERNDAPAGYILKTEEERENEMRTASEPGTVQSAMDKEKERINSLTVSRYSDRKFVRSKSCSGTHSAEGLGTERKVDKIGPRLSLIMLEGLSSFEGKSLSLMVRKLRRAHENDDTDDLQSPWGLPTNIELNEGDSSTPISRLKAAVGLAKKENGEADLDSNHSTGLMEIKNDPTGEGRNSESLELTQDDFIDFMAAGSVRTRGIRWLG